MSSARDSGLTRKQRREQARAERKAAEVAKQARRNQLKSGLKWTGIGVAALTVTVAAVIAAKGGPNGRSADRVVARIGSGRITKAAVEDWTNVTLAERPGASTAPMPPEYKACIAMRERDAASPGEHFVMSPRAICEGDYKGTEMEALSKLIGYQWVREEAVSLGVTVSNQEVEHRLNLSLPSGKLATLKGKRRDQALLEARQRLLLEEMQAKVEVTGKSSQKEIEAYYRTHFNRRFPEERTVETIYTKTQAQAMSAKREIGSGQGFASVAKRVSLKPVEEQHPREIVKEKSPSPAWRRAVFDTSAQVLGGPFKTPEGYVIFEVTGITSAGIPSLAEKLTVIRHALAREHFLGSFFPTWKPRTQCSPGYEASECSNFKPATTG